MKSIKKGFTLIELLIVIAIIGVLAVAFLPSVLGAPSKGRDTQRIAQVQKLQQLFTAQSVAGDKDFADLTTACIDETISAPKSVSKYVTDHLPDFGGVYPKDPQPDNEAVGATIGPCKGQYGFIKFANANAKKSYTAAVYVSVENDSNANILCSAVKDAIMTLDPGGITSTDTVDACYVALIQ